MMRNHQFKRVLQLSFMFLILLQFSSISQVFTVGPIETDSFPRLRATFTARDVNDKPFTDIIPADFYIKEGSYTPSVSDIDVQCETRQIDPEVNILLVLDQSNSMQTKDSISKQKRWEWVVEGAKEFINTLRFVGRTQCAITTFGFVVKLQCPFTNDKQRLVDSIDAVVTGGGTDYNPPFLDWQAGADVLLREKPADMRRIVIFLTDGNPERAVAVDSILKALKQSAIQVYSITMTLPMNKDLALISDQTGGKSFAVYTKDDLKKIYQLIALDLQTAQYCQLYWTAPYGCTELSRNRSVDIQFKRSTTTKVTKYYTGPPNSVAWVEVDKVIPFGDPDPGALYSVTKQIPLVARNSPIKVSKVYINPGGNFTITDWGGDGMPPPFAIDKDSTRIITIKFTQTTPKDYRQASLIIEGDPCPPLVTLIGGISQVLITYPTGGEVFSLCNEIEINWAGVEPQTPVILSYSTDNGNTWIEITKTATGLKYRWKPPVSSAQYKLKAEVLPTTAYLFAKSHGGPGNEIGKSLALQDDNLYFYVVGYLEDQALFEDKLQYSNGGTDIFIAKYGNQGNLAWVNRAGSMLNDSATGVCTDPDGNAYVTGTCYKDAQFGSLNPFMQEANKAYCFVAKYPPMGGTPAIGLIGATGFYTTFEAWGLRIKHQNGITTVRGNYRGEVKYPDGKYLPKANPGVFTAEFDQSLVLTKIEQNGTLYPDYSTTWDTDADNNKYETGGFAGSKTFGKYGVNSQGKSDEYITKYGTTPGSVDIMEKSFTVDSAKLAFVPATVDLGNCTIGSSVTKLFDGILKNIGDLPVWIKEAYLNGTNPDQFAIISGIDTLMMPGGSQNVEISFVPKTTGPLSAHYVIKDICSSPVVLTITGNGICSGIVEAEVNCGTENVGKYTDKLVSCIFKNTNTGSIRISPVVEGTNPGDFKLFDENMIEITGQVPLDPDECLNINVRFAPTGPGLRTAKINYNMPAGCEYKETILNGEGVDANIEFQDIDWKERRVLTVNDTILIIKNLSSLPAQLKTIEYETPDGTIFAANTTPRTINAGDTIHIPVSFTPNTEADYTNKLLLTVEAISNKIPVNLHGIGVLPKIETEWICDNPAKPGETSTAYLRVINPSTSADLYIEKIDFAGVTNDYEWPGGAAPVNEIIAKGTDKSYPVTFKPQAPGSPQTDIKIISDASAGPNPNPRVETIVKAKCDALGISADSPIDFGTWLLCDGESRMVQIYNTAGETPIKITGFYFSNADSAAFTILIPPDFEIPARGQRAFYVSFKPLEAKTYNTKLTLQNSINLDLVVELTGTGDFIKLYTPEKLIKKMPGFLHRLPVYAEIPKLQKGPLTDLQLSVIYDNNMLRYLNNATSFNSNLNNWTWDPLVLGTDNIKVSGNGSLPTPFKGELFSLDFDIFLGEREKSNLYFHPIHEPCVTQDTLGTTFQLVDVCFLAGRLVTVSKTKYMMGTPTPNPASDVVKVKFNVALEGETRMELINSMGEISNVLLDRVLQPGEYELTIPTTDIPSGAYYLRMNSGPFTRVEKMMISK